ncbi:MAG: PA2778 family cysteine peptidase [Bdellovibrionales bacterium]|nr:PA2778 family cysteine peptidase [Bdellovibrionales bacterium]
MRLIVLLFLILVSSCSTRSDLARKYSINKKVEISSVPFISQEEFQCGPAALSMMMSHAGKRVSTTELSAQAFTPNKQGSFQSDMITAVRRQKMIPVPLNELKNLLRELQAGNPVLVLQNLGLSWYPRWHYAVVVGYDLTNSEIILHSGKSSFMRISLYTFEKTWNRSENWSLLIVNPGEIPATVTEVEMIKATAHLEQMSLMHEASLGYQSVLKKWPHSLGALIGLGNIFYHKKDFSNSARVLKEATEFHPDSLEARFNYSVALKALKD